MSVKVFLESETSAYDGFSIVRLVSPYVNNTQIVKLYEHKNCPNGGRMFTIQEAWSNDTYCLGCDYQKSHSVAD